MLAAQVIILCVAVVSGEMVLRKADLSTKG